MTREEVIQSLVNDLETWDSKILLGYAQEARRSQLSSMNDKDLDDEVRFMEGRTE